MSNERGHYGRPRIGAETAEHHHYHQSTSWWTWIIGGLVVGGGVLWARHQSAQLEKLYKTAGLPQQSFTEGLKESAKALPTRAKETFRGFTRKSPPTSTPAAVPALRQGDE